MASNHIARINEDIQFALASLLRQVKDPRVQQGGLISIVRCDTTGDLRYCKVYLSVLGSGREGIQARLKILRALAAPGAWLRPVPALYPGADF